MTQPAQPTQGLGRNPQEVGEQQDDARSAARGRYLFNIITHGANVEILPYPDNPLSVAEVLSLTLPALGYQQKQCAEILDITVDTVKDYARRMRQKLNAKSNIQAFYNAQAYGYIRVLSNSTLEENKPTFCDEMRSR